MALNCYRKFSKKKGGGVLKINFIKSAKRTLIGYFKNFFETATWLSKKTKLCGKLRPYSAYALSSGVRVGCESACVPNYTLIVSNTLRA